MKKTLKIISGILIFTISMQAVVLAAASPPKRPIIDNGRQVEISMNENKDVLKPPTREIDLSGNTSINKKPERPVIEILTQNKPVNKGDVAETEDNTDDCNFPFDYEDEAACDENDILKTVTSSIMYITYEEAIIASECITECIGKGTWETSDELYNIALQYSDEALLEEVSDIYNKLNK